MDRFFGEHLECAEWNFSAFVWVLLLAIGLSLVRQDDLHVAFGAESARLEQGRLGRHTARVDVFARLNVVQSICHNSQVLKELVMEDVCCSRVHFL